MSRLRFVLLRWLAWSTLMAALATAMMIAQAVIVPWWSWLVYALAAGGAYGEGLLTERIRL